MKRLLPNRARTLEFESLENRELLSVNPLGTSLDLIPQSCVSQELTDRPESSPAELIALALGEPETPSTVVTTDADVVDAYDGEISLREALEEYSVAGDTITFTSFMMGKTITLNPNLGELTASKDITIDASNLYMATTSTPGVTISGGSATRIMNVAGDVSATLKGLTFADGKLSEDNVTEVGDGWNPSYLSEGGGAILNYGALTVQDCVFSDNDATFTYYVYYEGFEEVFYDEDGDVIDSVYYEGYGEDVTNWYSGGGIAVKPGGSLNANHCVFSGNDGDSVISFETDETSIITDCQIIDNLTDGVYLEEGAAQVSVEDCVLTGNTRGVCLDSNEGSVVVSGSELSSNGYGAIVYQGSLSLVDSKIMNNRWRGIYCSSEGVVDATNVVIADNASESHGAGVLLSGAMTLRNATITNNSATDEDGEGGGIYLDEYAVLNVYNSVIAGNTASDGADVYKEDYAQANAWNVLSSYSDWDSGANQLTYDASQPLFTDASEGDYSLASDSQAINRGNNLEVTTQTDIVGAIRIIGGIVDLGAYEYDAGTLLETPSTTVTTDEDVVDAYDGKISLREALEKYSVAGDTITFTSFMKGKTITLKPNLGELTASKDITIDASNLYTATTSTPGVTISGGSATRIMHIAGDVSATLKGLTFADCKLSGDNVTEEYDGRWISYHSEGGGAILNYGSLTVQDCAFLDNDATFTYVDRYETLEVYFDEDGNEVYTGDYVWIIGEELTNFYSGGAIAIKSGGSLNANHCVFSGNDGDGVISFETDETSIITDCQIIDNMTDGVSQQAGAAQVSVEDCVLTGNDYGNGVRLSSAAGSIVVSNSDLSSNREGAYVYQGSLSIVDSKIMNNWFGGIYCSSAGVVDATNVVIADNAIGYGPGVDLYGEMTLRNATITNNSVSNKGGGIYLNKSAVLNVYNSVVAGNGASDGADVYKKDGAQANAWNVLSSYSDWDSGANQLTYDASQPLFTDASQGDYSLASDSRAINRGNNLNVTTQTDIAGNTRIFDGIVDLGAYESDVIMPIVTVSSYDSLTREAVVEWSAISGAATYKLQLSKNGGETWANYRTGLTTTTATVIGLYAGKSYAFRVYGVSSSGATITEPYGEQAFAPISLSSSGDEYSVGSPIVVTQKGASNATSIIRWYNVTENGDVEITSARNSLTYTPTTAEYDIRVVATGTNDTEGSSSSLIFSKPAPQSPDMTVSSYDPSTREAVLEWNVISGAATYKLQLSKNGGETWANYRTGLTTTTATVIGLYAGKSYAFRVYGVSSSGATITEPYGEQAFAPISISSSDDAYYVGSPIVVTQKGASNASSVIKWYNVTENGDVEITSARNSLTYTPSSADYDIRVVATGMDDSEGCSSSLLFSKPAPQSPDVTVSSYDPSTRVAVVEWSAISGAATYKLQLSKNGGETWANYRTGLTTTTATVSGLYAGKSYAFRVYGVSSSGATITEPYGEQAFAPISLSSSGDEYSVGSPIVVTQKGASNASSIIRWYNVTENGDVEITSARNSLTYTPTSASFVVKVVATGSGDSEGCSSSLVFTPAQNPTVTVSSYDPSTREAVLEWSAISGAATYKLQLSKNGGETWANYRTGLTTLTTTVSGLYAGKSYAFRVYGVSNSGTTIPTPYAEHALAPISLSSTDDAYCLGSPIVVTQKGASNASSIIKWYNVTENGDVEITSARNSLTYTPSSADYDIKVVATGKGDSTGCSSSLTFAKPAPQSPDVTVSSYDPSTRQAVVEWSAISGAATYKLQLSKNGGETWANYRTGLTTTTATVSGLYVGKSYGFRVYGVSSSGTTLAVYGELAFSPSNASSSLLDDVFANFFEEEFFEV